MPATLYHAPFACSLAARFAAAEAELSLDTAYVALKSKELEDGSDFHEINPLGQVSVLVLENGEKLTETSTILLWIQSQAPNPKFRIEPTDKRYFQMVRWLGFCATELHKQLFRVVFYPEADTATKDRMRALVPARFSLLDGHFNNNTFLLGDRFSAADAYLSWFFVLSNQAGVDTGSFNNLQAYRDRVLGRPSIKAMIASDEEKVASTPSLAIL